MSDYKTIKARISNSLSKLEEMLADYEETATRKKIMSQKLNVLKTEHLNDLTELKTIYIYLFKSNQKELQPIDPNNPFAALASLIKDNKDKFN